MERSGRPVLRQLLLLPTPPTPHWSGVCSMWKDLQSHQSFSLLWTQAIFFPQLTVNKNLLYFLGDYKDLMVRQEGKEQRKCNNNFQNV